MPTINLETHSAYGKLACLDHQMIENDDNNNTLYRYKSRKIENSENSDAYIKLFLNTLRSLLWPSCWL